MGHWMSRQLKEAHEELRTPPARSQVLRDDPRSPSGGIERTPIETAADTPARLRRRGSEASALRGDGTPDSVDSLVSQDDDDSPAAPPPQPRKTRSVPDNLHRRIFERHPLAPRNLNRPDVCGRYESIEETSPAKKTKVQ